MKKRILNLLILVLIFGFQGIQATGSYFTSEEKINGLTFSTGCWAKPSIPQLVYPGNEYNAIPGSDWLANPYMDWGNSTSTCPLATTITYQYESYHDAGLTQIAYQSIWLSNSQIPAPGTPDGTYYWHVRARDQFGNTSDFSAPWLLTVDRSTPPPEPLPPETSGVVINEFLPSPAGADDADMPGGEWVELYNKSDSEINVNGWYLYDNHDTHALPIEASRTNTGNTLISSHGFLVIYRNGDSDFSLNQDADGDTVRLYNGPIATGALIDSHLYTGPVPEGKSIARIPDGSDTWFDPIPTPGGPNKLEEGPIVDFSLRSDKHAVSFQASNIKKFKTISYEITYDAQPEAKQIAGTADLGSEDSFIRENLLLGTCSSIEGKVCVYDWGMTKITLRVVLTLPNGETAEIIKEIAY